MQKIMVFVIIFCMVSFVIGSVGLKLIVGIFGGNNQLIATYGDEQKIKSPDFIQVQNELGVLRMLMADQLLMAQSGSGMTGPLLVHLLFPDSEFSAQIASQMKQAVQQGKLPISLNELDHFFQQRPERPEILWLLLKSEAHRAGCAVSNETAGQTLRYVIPQMTGNQLDAAGLVNQIIRRNNITEGQVLRILSDLMSVMAYADKVMDSQAVTINQTKATLGRSKERIDADFVKIEAKPLIDENADITEPQIQAQFDAYKAAVANNLTDDNPFGFGYKLPKQVQLEYMVVLMDDVNQQIEKPTAEAVEEYYSRHIARFQTSKPSDPNDSESEKIIETRPFAEVEADIRRALEAEKALTQTNILFNEIKDKTESGFETLNFDAASAGELQKAAGDFVVVGGELAEKYNIPIAVGKTGWLDAAAFGQDKILANMGVRRGQNLLRLNDLAFAAAEDKPQQQRIGIPSVRVWQNIGPLSGGYYSEKDSEFYRLMALVRVVGIQEAAVADTVNTTFDTRGIVLGDLPTEDDDTTVSLADRVKDDLRLQAAMMDAKARANELAASVSEQGWENAIAAYNSKYAKDEEPSEEEDAPAEEEAVDSQRIELGSIKQQLRISQAEIERAKRIMLENPASARYLRQQIASHLLTNQLNALLGEDAETTGEIQTVLASEAERVCYVVKEVVRQPATIDDYLDNKAQTALQLSVVESASLALVHFGPENILARMGYQPQQQEEADDPPEEEVPAAKAENEEN
ncbi:MAG: hypothetical protein B6I25_02245 [Planctomycetales bacterium 4572_13]|nr:MAG: hypothetical protein B6I25_02245 [Planctomycetales bacterium 4572_13]